MEQQKITQEAFSELRLFAKWIISSFIDSIFIAFWVFIQWGTNKIIDNFLLFDIDLFVLWCFRIIFAGSTLVPILIYIYEDTMIMVYRAVKRVREEKNNLPK